MPLFIPLESRLRKEGCRIIAGIDEAGRGPMAGPVVCAAVILKERMKLSGLNDSKKVSKKNRERLFQLITKNSLDYSISIVSHLTIDSVNIVNAVQLGNYQCIEHLKYKPDIVLIDGRDKQILDIDWKTIIKGDQKIRSIAAASILAKVFRDNIMKYYASLYPKYEFQKHMGYGTRLHRSHMEEFGPCEIHRKSYSFNDAKNSNSRKLRR